MKSAFVDIPEGQVHYRTEGKGEPVLLLHQSPQSSNEYAMIIPILARKYRVIAMDTMGYGYSDKPPRPYSIEEYARSVVSFLDALDVKRTHVAGSSTGAGIAIELAATYPERVAKLVLSGPPCFKQPEEGQAWLSNPRVQPFELKADGSHLMEVWERAKVFADVSLELAHEYTLDLLRGRVGARADEAHPAIWVYDSFPKLPRIKSPTLLLIGDKHILYPWGVGGKEVTPDELIGRAKKLLPSAMVKIIKGGDTSVTRLMPKEWAQAVLDFLAEP